jgi:hypothetical protein
MHRILAVVMVSMMAAPATTIGGINNEQGFNPSDKVELQKLLIGDWYRYDGTYLLLRPGGGAVVGQLYVNQPQHASWHTEDATTVIYTVTNTSKSISREVRGITKNYLIIREPNEAPGFNNEFTRDDGTPYVKLRGSWQRGTGVTGSYFVYTFTLPENLGIVEYRNGRAIKVTSYRTHFSPGHVKIREDVPMSKDTDYSVTIIGKTLKLTSDETSGEQLGRCNHNDQLCATLE